MPDDYERDLITYDPLSEVTRKERRALLGLAVLGVALVKVPLVPEKFSALGIDLTLQNQQNFLLLYAMVLVYFLAAFLLYGLADYTAWRRTHVRKHHGYEQRQLQKLSTLPEKTLDALEEGVREREADLLRERDLVYWGFASYHLALAIARLRAAFEFLFPIIFALYAIGVLLVYSG